MDNNEKTKKNKKNDTLYKDKKVIWSFIVGLVVGLLILAFTYPKRIAKLENGEEILVKISNHNFTAEEVFSNMREYYGVANIINSIDEVIFKDKYDLTEDQENKINDQIDYYLNLYQTNYNMTEQEFYEQNGFKNRQEFYDVLAIDFQKSLYVKEYVSKDFKEEDIQKYYDEKIFGDTESKYITVAKETEEDDKEERTDLANKIIKKIKNGATYAELVKTYKNDERILKADLEKVKYDTELEDAYVNAMIALDEDSYSTKYVETSSGYTIIFKGKVSDKPKLEDVKDFVIEKLVNAKLTEDDKLYNKALIQLREENKIEFLDSEYKSQYEDYINDNK